ncbi:hypothetical protein EDD21DRAFT_206128 [Dissophora ornata]|nr:hypothetical protein EDD21DRAFT_206128 [Dissophora ornata]
MKNQMRDVVDRMWSAFGNTVDSTWADYLGLDIDVAQYEPLPVRSGSSRPQSDSQHEFTVPGSVDIINNGAQHSFSKTWKPFLIDFVQLDVDLGFTSFEHVRDAHSAVPFRTQVRIRTNGEAISRLWEVAFYVKSGQIVTSTSRGTFRQQGLKVVVTSNPDAEAELNMVVRFVIEGVETVPVRDPKGSKDSQPEDSRDVFEAASLPDPTSARFETKPFLRHKHAPLA